MATSDKSRAEPQDGPSRQGEPPLIEPPLIERARRSGWLLLGAAVLALILARSGAAGGMMLWQGVAIGCGLLGLLAIVNVALVRGIYAQIAAAPRPQDAPPSEQIADADRMVERDGRDDERGG